MQLFTIVLVLHVLATFTLGIGVIASWLSIWRLRESAAGRLALRWISRAAYARGLTISSAVGLFVTGLYLSVALLSTHSLGIGWIVMSIIAMSILIVISIDDRRQLQACRTTLQSISGPLPKVLQESLRDSSLVRYLYISTCLCLSLLALMLFRPTLVVSAVVVIAPCGLSYIGGRLQEDNQRRRIVQKMASRSIEK